ncbi:hypothetical protein GGX14DRAFT_389975 [Mycena pura]|uniref:Uncharacterized protein n=1 Tax=Mycena pura TaxID=153505 RepID=A0AAD6VQ02_9AGAR|nr:hypothetical protein GGX14DRAFT_389975 [Mycena pura]
MTGNAYAQPGREEQLSFPFGWEDLENGFRGHVFMSSDNSTVMLSIKGTTLQGPTSKRDKLNDNLRTKALIEESLFYNVGVCEGLRTYAWKRVVCPTPDRVCLLLEVSFASSLQDLTGARPSILASL